MTLSELIEERDLKRGDLAYITSGSYLWSYPYSTGKIKSKSAKKPELCVFIAPDDEHLVSATVMVMNSSESSASIWNVCVLNLIKLQG